VLNFVTERQKVIRKIKQAQNCLEQAEGKSQKKKINAEVQELRVDLNYILVSFAFKSNEYTKAILVEALSKIEEIHLSLPTRST